MTEPPGSPWQSDAVRDQASDVVSLVEGTTFVVSGRSGSIGEGATQGLYLLDTRVVAAWRVMIDDWQLEPLVFVPDGPFSATFVSRATRPRLADSPIALVQRRHVGQGMREDLEIRNHGPACRLVVRLGLGTDLAGLFEVKAGHTTGRTAVRLMPCERGVRFVADADPARPGPFEAVTFRSSRPPDAIDADHGLVTWHIGIGQGETWRTCLEIGIEVEGAFQPPSHPCGAPIEEASPVGRLTRWRVDTPGVASASPEFDRMVERGVDDLGSLRIFDPDHADRVVVAAGAPWFMALFGRDSLVSSWMALPFDQALARGVLAELADNQGRRYDDRTEEQPGRILHEVRLDRYSTELLGGASTYFGTVDATPLFVALAGELTRWTGITDHVARLLPAIDRALAWIDVDGDRDGDGFVEYARSSPTGLEHQGWKDSWDGIRHEDGRVAAPPIALCEVQGYVYAAWRARATLARAAGDAATAESFDARADELRDRFDARFWLDDLGTYAVGLDAEHRPIRSRTSNVGHLLWTGIVPEGRAAQVATELVSPALFTGWGVRTLASDSPGYNPLSYHCGSVWPHDTAIAVAGLGRYGFDREAQTVAAGLIDAATASGGRLPELFGGFDRDDVHAPVPYPTSCSPQAWAAASPLLLLRTVLGLDPDVPAGVIRLRPRVPPSLGRLHVTGVPIGGTRVDIEAEREMAIVSGTDLEVSVR